MKKCHKKSMLGLVFLGIILFIPNAIQAMNNLRPDSPVPMSPIITNGSHSPFTRKKSPVRLSNGSLLVPLEPAAFLSNKATMQAPKKAMEKVTVESK